MTQSIGERLKAFRIEHQLSIPEIARATGIDKETLYGYERGSKPADITLYTRLKDHLDSRELVAEPRITSGNQMEYKRTHGWPAAQRLALTSYTRPVSMYVENIASGTIVIVDDKPELIVEPIYGPFLSQAEGLVEITSESMEPTFKRGSRIAISRQLDFRQLVWGQCYYVINKSLECFVRRLYQGQTDTHIQLLSDHPDQQKYPPITLGLDKIEAICRIRAEIISH